MHWVIGSNDAFQSAIHVVVHAVAFTCFDGALHPFWKSTVQTNPCQLLRCHLKSWQTRMNFMTLIMISGHSHHSRTSSHDPTVAVVALVRHRTEFDVEHVWASLRESLHPFYEDYYYYCYYYLHLQSRHWHCVCHHCHRCACPFTTMTKFNTASHLYLHTYAYPFLMSTITTTKMHSPSTFATLDVNVIHSTAVLFLLVSIVAGCVDVVC